MCGYVISAVNGFVGKYWLSDDSPWELIVDDIFERSLELILLLKRFFLTHTIQYLEHARLTLKSMLKNIRALTGFVTCTYMCICRLGGDVVGGG